MLSATGPAASAALIALSMLAARSKAPGTMVIGSCAGSMPKKVHATRNFCATSSGFSPAK